MAFQLWGLSKPDLGEQLLISPEMVFRETDVVTLSQLGREFLRPERIRLKFSDEVRAAPVDIGSLAYSVRVEPDWRQVVAGKPIMVDMNSFQEYRRELIRSIVDSFFISGSRERSILFSCKNYRYVIDWCDTNGFSDVFCSVDSTRKAYLAYNDYLRDEILVRGALKPSTCAGRQSFFVQLIKMMFGSDEAHITHGVPTIRAGAHMRPEPPRENEVAGYVSVCVDLAKNFSRFVLEGDTFPLETQCAGEKVVVFPSMTGLLTPITVVSSVNKIYNYSECRLATIEEYVAKTGYPPSVCARGINAAQRTIDQANSDLRHQQRIRLASFAMNAYVCLFSLLTGAMPAELAQFDIDDALEIEKSLVKREFDSVKFRAGGKKTRYVIGRGPGLQLLRDYLKIRSWLLDGKYYKHLFFSLERKGSYTGGVKALSQNFSYEFHDKLKGVFLHADFVNIAPSRGRKYKSLVLHQLKSTPDKVSAVLNHTEMMNVSSYAETTVDRFEKEFQVYWRSVRRAGERVRAQAESNESPTAVGHCDEINHPEQISEVVPIELSCRTQYGCLYCINYVCHADEEDVHKISSLQYVISVVKELAVDIDHADRMFQGLSVRIDFLLDEISKTSSAASVMVDRIKYRVFELGELTPFWESRLQRYEFMGVVF